MSYRAVVLTVGGAGLTACLQFAVRAVMARFMGQDGYGELSLGLALCAVLATLCTLGMSSYLARGLAYRLAAGDPAGGKRVVRLSMLVPLAVSAVTALALFGSADRLASVFEGGDRFADTLRVLSFLVPVLVGISLLEAFGRGVRRVWYYVGLGSVVPAALKLLLVATVAAAGIIGVTEIAASYVLASGAALLLGALVMRKEVLRVFSVPGWGEPDARVIRFSSGALATQALGIARARSDIVLMGVLMSMGQVGLYSAALSLAALIQIGLSAVNQVLMPWLATEYAQGRAARMRDAYKSASAVTLCITLPLLLSLLMGAEETVRILFGEEFQPASLALQILVIGYFVNSISGSFGAAFVAVGEPGWSMVVTGVGFASSVMGLLLLVPRYGLLGAAIAMTTSFVLSSLIGASLAAVKLGLVPWSLRQAKLGLVVAVSFTVAYLLIRSGDPVANVALLPVRVITTYVGATWFALRMNYLAPVDRSALGVGVARLFGRLANPR